MPLSYISNVVVHIPNSWAHTYIHGSSLDHTMYLLYGWDGTRCGPRPLALFKLEVPSPSPNPGLNPHSHSSGSDGEHWHLIIHCTASPIDVGDSIPNSTLDLMQPWLVEVTNLQLLKIRKTKNGELSTSTPTTYAFIQSSSIQSERPRPEHYCTAATLNPISSSDQLGGNYKRRESSAQTNMKWQFPRYEYSQVDLFQTMWVELEGTNYSSNYSNP